jgi:peptidyl-prolyl cis-trans isomerase A (cyclophilin A)
MPRGILAGVLLSLAACGGSKDDPKPDPNTAEKTGPTSLPQGRRHARPPGATASIAQPSSPDPRAGRFTLDDALVGMPAKGELVAKLDTDAGTLECRLFDEKAPIAVANFVGLARGLRPAWDGSAWTARRAYDDTVFHRVLQGLFIQGGSARADDDAGYVIPDEAWGGRHDHAGQLCVAARGKDAGSKQFFITDGAAPHLDEGYTIFGECSPIDVIHRLASVPVKGEQPLTPPVIRSVRIERGGQAEPGGVASVGPSSSAAPSASARRAPSAAPSSKPRASAAPAASSSP